MPTPKKKTPKKTASKKPDLKKLFYPSPFDVGLTDLFELRCNLATLAEICSTTFPQTPLHNKLLLELEANLVLFTLKRQELLGKTPQEATEWVTITTTSGFAT